MNLHEYQSKQLSAQHGIPVPKGRVASSPDDAVAAAKALGASLWVVKAQVHAGGRGRAGGVTVRSPAELGSAIAKRLKGKSTVRVKMTSSKRSKPKRVSKKFVRKAVKKMPSRTARKAAPRRPT
jgi:succinyl-CoA synthetase beta subunit